MLAGCWLIYHLFSPKKVDDDDDDETKYKYVTHSTHRHT